MVEATKQPEKKIKIKREKVIATQVRFEFTIPDDVPQNRADMYIWEKLKRLCRGLSKKGLKVIPIVPSEFAD